MRELFSGPAGPFIAVFLLVLMHFLIFRPVHQWLRKGHQEILASLEYAIDDLIGRMPFPDRSRAYDIKVMVRDYAQPQGPKLGSWYRRVTNTVRRIEEAWGGDYTNGLSMALIVTENGFGRDSLEHLEGVLRGLRRTVLSQVKDPALQGDEAERFIIDCAVGLMVDLAQVLPESDRTSVRANTLSRAASTYVLGGKHDFRDMVLSEEGRTFTFADFVRVYLHCHRVGITDRTIRRFIGHQGLPALLHHGAGVEEGLLDLETFTHLSSAPKMPLASMGSELYELAQAWKQVGRPGTLIGFRRLGGTVEAYRAHEAERQREREVLQREARQRREEARQAQGELDQGSAGPPGQDFDWIMAELELEGIFEDLDEHLLRVLVVHGFLRNGDRIEPLTRPIVRDTKKLWKACKPYVADGINRRNMESLRNHLVQEGVLSCRAGEYRLAQPGPSQTEARALREQIVRLAQTYAH